MLQLKQSEFTLLPSQKIIQAETYSTFLEAQSIIEKARKEAQAILQSSQAAHEAQKQKGFQEGLAEGKAQIAQHMLESVTATIKNLESFESEVVDIVLQAIKRILGEMDNTELIMRVTKHALGLVKSQKRVTLRVSPKDASRLENKVNELLSEFPTVNFIDVVPDQRLQEGDAMLETDIGAVDARIETQLEAIRKSLTKAIK